MIVLNDKTACCGCAACYNSCPIKCIRMVEDNEGFLYPKIKIDLCINCRLCEKVCPLAENNIPVQEEFQTEYYIVQSKDDRIRAESTSGGAFTPLAQAILARDGVICGAAFVNHEHYQVRHRFVSNEEELKVFRGSKYVQSEIADCMRQCKIYLDEGCQVLFSGTPCQIAGLKKYLRKEYDNLFTLDVVCRAVPSPKVFRKYLEYQRKHMRGAIKNIRFRDKSYGYDYSTMSIYTGEGQEYHKGIESDLYLRTFFSGICDRPSCTTCKFRSLHLSDITIWDCFNVAAIDASWDDNKGTTRLAVNTERGKTLLKKSADWLRIKQYFPIQGKKEVAYKEREAKKIDREEFFNDIDVIEADAFFDKYFPYTTKVRVLEHIRYLSFRLGIYRVIKKVWNHYKNR